MPKTDNPLTKPKTSPGISYTIPSAKLIDAVILEDAYTYLVALDGLEEAYLDAAALEVIQATVPGYRGDYVLPVIRWNGRTVLRVHGQFPPVLKGPDGKPRKLVRAGATVTIRAMLKCWPCADGMTVVAYPSRIDVHGKAPVQGSTRKAKTAEPAQIDMPLVTPADPVAEPAPIGRTKPRKAAKPKSAPKPKAPTKNRAVVLPPGFDKEAYAAHRARVVEVRARLRREAEAADAPKPARKTKAKAAPALPSNVVPFPIHLARKPS